MSEGEGEATPERKDEAKKAETAEAEKKAEPKQEEPTPAAPDAREPAARPDAPPTPKPTQATPPVMKPSGPPEQATLPAKEGALPKPVQPTGEQGARGAGETATPATPAPAAKPAAAAKPAPKPVAWPFPAQHSEPTDTEDLDAIDSVLSGAIEKRGMDATHKPVAYVKPEKLWDVANHAATELGFDHLACLTAIDYPSEGKLDVTYNLYSYPRGRHLVLKALIPREKPEVASVTSIWRGANWHEREIWDMFGIRFTGHPDLRRIFLPEGWRGHPLLKDYDMKEQFIGMDDETGEDVVYDEPGEYRW